MNMSRRTSSLGASRQMTWQAGHLRNDYGNLEPLSPSARSGTNGAASTNSAPNLRIDTKSLLTTQWISPEIMARCYLKESGRPKGGSRRYVLKDKDLGNIVAAGSEDEIDELMSRFQSGQKSSARTPITAHVRDLFPDLTGHSPRISPGGSELMQEHEGDFIYVLNSNSQNDPNSNDINVAPYNDDAGGPNEPSLLTNTPDLTRAETAVNEATTPTSDSPSLPVSHSDLPSATNANESSQEQVTENAQHPEETSHTSTTTLSHTNPSNEPATSATNGVPSDENDAISSLPSSPPLSAVVSPPPALPKSDPVSSTVSTSPGGDGPTNTHDSGITNVDKAKQSKQPAASATSPPAVSDQSSGKSSALLASRLADKEHTNEIQMEGPSTGDQESPVAQTPFVLGPSSQQTGLTDSSADLDTSSSPVPSKSNMSAKTIKPTAATTPASETGGPISTSAPDVPIKATSMVEPELPAVNSTPVNSAPPEGNAAKDKGTAASDGPATKSSNTETNITLTPNQPSPPHSGTTASQPTSATEIAADSTPASQNNSNSSTGDAIFTFEALAASLALHNKALSQEQLKAKAHEQQVVQPISASTSGDAQAMIPSTTGNPLNSVGNTVDTVVNVKPLTGVAIPRPSNPAVVPVDRASKKKGPPLVVEINGAKKADKDVKKPPGTTVDVKPLTDVPTPPGPSNPAVVEVAGALAKKDNVLPPVVETNGTKKVDEDAKKPVDDTGNATEGLEAAGKERRKVGTEREQTKKSAKGKEKENKLESKHDKDDTSEDKGAGSRDTREGEEATKLATPSEPETSSSTSAGDNKHDRRCTPGHHVVRPDDLINLSDGPLEKSLLEFAANHGMQQNGRHAAPLSSQLVLDIVEDDEILLMPLIPQSPDGNTTSPCTAFVAESVQWPFEVPSGLNANTVKQSYPREQSNDDSARPPKEELLRQVDQLEKECADLRGENEKMKREITDLQAKLQSRLPVDDRETSPTTSLHNATHT